jgi:hypothetical protein
MTREQEIRHLVEKYYYLVAQDHHKDRDCHFEVTLNYKYDGQCSYQVDHFGYCNPEIHEDFETLKQAKQYLITKLKEYIASEEGK